MLCVLAHAAQDRLTECLTDAFDRNAIEDLLEKAADDQPRRLLSREAARLGVENQLFINLTAGRAVRAADIVALNLQAGNRIGPGIGGQKQVVVPLITVCLDCLWIDLDHAAPYGARLVLQGALIE